jgi:hypothetical protein
MKYIKVNKPENVWQLKILFPGIKLAVDGVPAYGDVVFCNFPMRHSEKSVLVLEQSTAGFNLDSHLGLLGFLRSCEYMSPAKINRFEMAGRAPEIDSKGNEVISEGKFYKNPGVVDMYNFCSTLKVSNRVFLNEDGDAGYILDVLESSLYDRLKEADKVGPGALMERVLRFLDSFYAKDIQFKARGQGRSRGFDRMQRVMNMFSRKSFKDFKLSGNDVEDSYTFLCLFEEVACG